MGFLRRGRNLFVATLLMCLGACFARGSVAAGTEADRVVLLANASDSASLELARYYAEKRGVPLENILSLPLASAETIGWQDYVSTLLNPLRRLLIQKGWIDALSADKQDLLGRDQYAFNSHRIAYLVVCRGVPLKFNADPGMFAEPQLRVPLPQVDHAGASVDGELALLAQANTPARGFVANPLFRKENPSALELTQIVRVSRLDGPSDSDARALLDHALSAEKFGLIGRSYVDIGGPHAGGDRWLEETAKTLETLGLDGAVDRLPGTLSPTVRFDAPALYFGWYAGALNGPFANPGFTFPPGAIALHIYSFSAQTVRSSSDFWVGPLVARGVSATVGNVTEPYLEFTHQPQLLLQALARGATWGEAITYAVPVYSWQGMAIGDPLYRPFKYTIGEQWARRERLPPSLRPYVALRHMHILARQERMNEAIFAGEAELKAAPNLPVTWALAELQRKAGDEQGEKLALLTVNRPSLAQSNFGASEGSVAALIAQRLAELGDHANALSVWRRLLTRKDFTPEQRKLWLPEAIAAARAAKAPADLRRWEAEK